MSAGGGPDTTVTFGHGLAVVNVNVNGAYVSYTRRREARAQPRARSQSVTIGGFGGQAVSGARGPARYVQTRARVGRSLTDLWITCL
jgi:hypothetical protein